MKYFSGYSATLIAALELVDDESVSKLESDLINLWSRGGKLFICGNGGSGGNAIHLANDFIFGAGYPYQHGLKVEALTANSVGCVKVNKLSTTQLFPSVIKTL